LRTFALWELSEPEEVGGLFEGGTLREFVDVDAAIGEDAGVTVDPADRGAGGDDAFQAFRCDSGGHKDASPDENLVHLVIAQRRNGCHGGMREYRYLCATKVLCGFVLKDKRNKHKHKNNITGVLAQDLASRGKPDRKAPAVVVS